MPSQAMSNAVKTTLLISMSVVTMLLIGCSSQSNQSTNTKPAPATNNNSSSGFAALSAANNPILVNGQASTTLVNIVRNAGKSVGVFEFVGVTCESCKTESPMITSQLAPYAASVTRVVIFPNQVNQYTSSEYQTFVNTYAVGSTYAVDNDLTLLKSIRANTNQYFGIFVIVKSDGTGMVLNQDDAASRVISNVQTALQK